MQFQYKIQDYQTEAVQAVVKAFEGQELAINQYSEEYIHDVGRKKIDSLFNAAEMAGALYSDHGVRNLPIVLKDELKVKTSDTEHGLLNNIVEIQRKKHILESSELINKVKKGNSEIQLGRVLLDVEMETGTGKTYVYIKTMYELNKVYGWKKFIIVVPSIAIREGVKKSFDTMEQHFQEIYGKKVRCFIYNSSNLVELDRFATDPGINVMIINMQAFSSSFAGEEKADKNSLTKKIYTRTDNFGSRRPIDVIAEVNPIIIMDEPQKMGGNATLKSLQQFDPLFVLNYSATHKEHHNTVYVLDALDAYKKKLVKRIEVKGIEAKNTTAQGSYVYLERIVTYSNKPAEAKLRIEVKHGATHKRETHTFKVGDSLGTNSNNLQEYANCRVESIDPVQQTVTIGGNVHVTLQVGESYGDMQEQDIRRIQISETIQSHFAKEHDLFQIGVKCLSLFFIDEVAKYRLYDEEGQEKNGIYGEIFEEEYQEVWREYAERYRDDAAYQEYLQTICRDPHAAHRGYFSIDKKTGRSVDGVKKSREDESTDISAYDLILKNKERLLSFEEPTRFIFSHSALREGWDNPNIFQICTLKNSDNEVSKRQEVGRGMRLCVDQDGRRMDKDVLMNDVQGVNTLTVIASESYSKFVDDLQKDIKENLYERPKEATPEIFEKYVKKANGDPISKIEALSIYTYMVLNGYVDENMKVTDKCRKDIKGEIAELPETLVPLKEEIKKVIESIYDEKAFEEMVGKKPVVVIKENRLKDENFNRREFQELWRKINHKYAYSVDFKTDRLIEDAVAAIDKDLVISSPIYEIVTLEQNKDMELHERATYQYGDGLTKKIVDGSKLKACRVPYDLVGKVAKAAMVTRKTAAAILSKISKEKFERYQINPEEFIVKVAKIIVAKKANIVVESIQYWVTNEEPFPTPEIFLMQKAEIEFAKAVPAKKHISEYVFTDGTSDNSVEKEFVRNLELADEVLVYAKLPRSFYIPTPVGNYSPDWAIAFKAGTMKHVYFIAETKGSTSKEDLRPIEDTKIKCAEKLFNTFKCAEDVRYHAVATYADLINVMKDIQ